MKIAVDPGHNCPPDVGCSGLSPKYPTEDRLTKRLAALLLIQLRNKGHKCISVLPPSASTVTDSLRQRVNMANKFGADLYVSLHFNCFDKEAHGTEVYAISNTGRKYAQAVLENIVDVLGTTNRGVKDGSHLFVVRETTMPAILIETCFVDNEEDMQKYTAENKEQEVSKAIADGIESISGTK